MGLTGQAVSVRPRGGVARVARGFAPEPTAGAERSNDVMHNDAVVATRTWLVAGGTRSPLGLPDADGFSGSNGNSGLHLPEGDNRCL